MIRILFVDDEQSVLDGLKRTLRPFRKQWAASFASSGSNALEQLQASPFDAIVTDMRMPGMDGLALLKRVTELYPDLLRVVLSGQSELEKFIRSERAAHHYLSKPCSLDTLQSTVNRAFSLRRLFADPGLLKLVAAVPWRPPQFLRAESPEDLLALLRDNSQLCKNLLLIAQGAGFLKVETACEPSHLVHALGVGPVKGMLLAAELCSCSHHPEQGASDSTWTQWLVRSTYAKRLARFLMASNGELHDQAQIAGLLLDVGQVVLRRFLPDAYAQVLEVSARDKIATFTAERQLLGASHAELSAYILAEAGLPDAVAESIAYHHSPAECPDPDSQLLLAVHLADVLSLGGYNNDGDDGQNSLDSKYLDTIGQATDLCEWRKVAVGTVN